MTKHKTRSVIPRNSLIWLLVAQALVIAPHLWHMPLWIAGLWLICALWRIQVFRMRMRFPISIVKVGMILSAAFAVYLSRGGLVGLDAGVALLLTAFVMKLVELRSKRDALVLIYLGFFVVVTSFLFEDGPLAALYSVLPVVALVAALIGLQQTALAEKPRQTFKLALRLLLQALPVALLLFMFFPRLDPLWTLPLPKDKGITGLSDKMSPGDIAELSQSSKLVFRATFNGEIPAQNQLYWRALTLPYFDGRSWHFNRTITDLLSPEWQKQGRMLDYSIIMQPSARPWLYSLAASEAKQNDIRMMNDFRLQRNTPVHRAYFYQTHAWPDALLEPKLAPERLRDYLQLPHTGNSQARSWATQLRQEYPNDELLVNAILRHFNQAPFYYTLKPPLLGENSVDEFLFETRRGFCEHYSSAMTFVLRAAGIPARVVIGYQGGEVNLADNFVQVRQLDAHSWVEYWRLGHGWHRVDPTFQVAPARIERGLQEALQTEAEYIDTGLFSPLSYRHVQWVNQLRITWDTINYRWHVHVLSYQAEQQQAWLARWLGQVGWQQIGIILVVAVAIFLTVLSLWIFKPWQNKRTWQQKALQRLDKLLARTGQPRAAQEGLRAYQRRVAASLSIVQQESLAAFINAYEQEQYAGLPVNEQELKQYFAQLRQHFRGLRLKHGLWRKEVE